MTARSPFNNSLAQNVRAMYNAHPFPNYPATPATRSDERNKIIYEQFLHIPLDNLNGKLILDAGCGTGENTWSWRRIVPPNARVIGMDWSATSIKIASSRADQIRPHFSVGSLLDLGIADQSVDVVFCSGALVAVTEPTCAFRELIRILKPGGYLILVLYQRYGRLIHGLRRTVVNLIEKNDVDRRARLGGKLFGRSMRKLSKQTEAPLEGILYDQFGLPCESRYSVGQVLHWLDQAGIRYIGSWPPVEWSQMGKAIRHSYGLAKYSNTWFYRLLTKVFSDTVQVPTSSPHLLDQASMQMVWALNQLQMFSMAGRKA